MSNDEEFYVLISEQAPSDNKQPIEACALWAMNKFGGLAPETGNV